MKIDTNKIKNKRFTTPIESEPQKHSQEYRVLATLRYLYPNRFENMITSESPDLQDKENGIGIEVTVAVDWRDMRASREFANLQQKDVNTEKYKKAIASSGYSIFPIKENRVAICTSGTSDGEKFFFQESIRKKIKYLQRYKTEFKKVGLAVILPEIPTSDAEVHFCEWIAEVFGKSSTVFDFVYVLSHRFCIFYDVQEEVVEKRTINETEAILLATIARMTAEGKLSLSDEEWR